MIRYSWNRRRGFATIQVILILVIAMMILLAIRSLVAKEGAPAALGSAPQATANPSSSGAAAAKPRPAARPAAGGAAAANERLAQLPDLAKYMGMANIGYSRNAFQHPGEDYNTPLKELTRQYTISPPIDIAGFQGRFLVPIDPNDKKVIFTIGGTESVLDVVADIGQLLPRIGADRAAFGVSAGFLRNPVSSILTSVGALALYGSSQAAEWQYRGGLTVAQALVKKYGAENVIVVGHSKGGGIASYISGMLGIRGYGFNAAPLGPDNINDIKNSGTENPQQYFTNVNSEYEGVHRWPLNGQQIGEAITVGGKDQGTLAWYNNHSTGNFELNRGVAYQPATPLR